MSNATDSPNGSPGSIAVLALMDGLIIILLLIMAKVLGWIAQLDAMLGTWMSWLLHEDFSQVLSNGVQWIMAILIAFGLPALLLSCRQAWQRLTVWLISLAILALWGPVLCLAAHRPEISLVWLAAVVAGPLVTFHRYHLARQQASASSDS